MRADVHSGPNDVNHRKLARALAARSTSEGVGPERRQRPSSDLRRSPAPAKDRPSRATRLLASESTPRGDILALQPVHRSRWTACRRGSAAPPTMVLEENIRVSGVSPRAQRGGKVGSAGSRLPLKHRASPAGSRPAVTRIGCYSLFGLSPIRDCLALLSLYQALFFLFGFTVSLRSTSTFTA